MSIGKRLLNLVRSNLSSVFERATAKGEGARGGNLEDMSEEEIEAELLRRRERRTAAERAADSTGAGYSAEDWNEMEQAVRDGSRYRTTGRRSTRRTGSYTAGARRGASVGSPGTRDPRLAQLYAQLECPYGSDLTTIRKHYRALMRKYHPDMHSTHPDKQRVATDLSQRLTGAYNELRRLLAGGAPSA